MTKACGVGVLLLYTFDDSSSFHVRLCELFSAEMRLLLERLQDLHGRIVSIGEPRSRCNVKISESRGMGIKELPQRSAFREGNTGQTGNCGCQGLKQKLGVPALQPRVDGLTRPPASVFSDAAGRVYRSAINGFDRGSAGGSANLAATES